MSKDAIMRLEKTVLYEQLVLKEGNDHQLSELVKKIVANVAPILATVGNNMPEFTLHDANHSAKVVELMSMIIPEDVLEKLNIIELTLLILSGYIHDVGMTCSNEEREEIIKNDLEYAKLIIEDMDKSNLLKKYKSEGDNRVVTIIENQLFTEYLRRNHVKRSRKYIDDNLSQGELLLNWNETSLYQYLISICDSHELPVGYLNDLKKWPRKQLIRNVRVNIQYLSLILRLADILDLDPERTPKCILEFTNPKDPKSIVQWKKHRSIIGWDVTPEHIEFSAECTDSNCERALREFLGWIEIERRDSLAIILKYNDDISKDYRIDLNEPVAIDGVKSDGSYIYSDFKFKLDYRRVLDILMGQRLYKNPCVALRELLQNAFDTMNYRKIVEVDGYSPKVKVILEDGYLTVEDNGMGMDENIFNKYFINVGKSYYSSSECTCDKDKMDVTSEFGIGILSVFMIAESIEVESRKRPDNPLQPPQPILVEIPKAHDYFIQRNSKRVEIGTKIRLKLKEDNPITCENLVRLIKELVPFPKYPIEVYTKEDTYTYDFDNKEVLEGKIEKIIHKILFNKGKEDDGSIDGLMYIVRDMDAEAAKYSGKHIVAQKGFKIGLPILSSYDQMQNYDNSMTKLLPQWIGIIPFINLAKTYTLTITPDRSDVVIDSQFMRVKKKIEDKIIEGMFLYLNDIKERETKHKYLDAFNNLLEQHVIVSEDYSSFEISENAIKFILDTIPLLILDEQGKEHIIFGREIKNIKLLVVISEEDISWVKDRKALRQSIYKYLGNETIVIINQEEGDYTRAKWLQHIYGKFNGKLILEEEGVICSLIDYSEKHIGSIYIEERMEFSDNIIGAKRCADMEILLSLSPSCNISMEIIYNMNHPIFTMFNIEKGIDNNDYQKLLLKLDCEIRDILNNSIRQISKTTTDIEWLREKETNENFNFCIINIFDKIPNLIEELNNILLKFWEMGKEIGAIEGNPEFPSINRDSFPWFW